MSRFLSHLDTVELTAIYTRWVKTSGVGRNKSGLRFGQWLCNYCLKTGESFPELFYEENASEAYSIAYAELLEETL